MTGETRFLDSGGRRIAYSDSGGAGDAVLLGHGFGLDRSMFAAQVAELGERWRIVTWDSPGHGDSPESAEPFSYWDLARDQVALLDALGIERAAVGGVSQGGFTALRTALTAPERVSALVLVDTEAGALDPVDAEAYAGLFAALAAQGPRPELVGPLAGQIVGDHPAGREQARIWQERGVPLGEAVRCLTGRDDVVGRLPGITAPALLVRGELDASIPPERMELLFDGLAHPTEVQVVAGAWHSPPVTHPGATTALLRAFLSGGLRPVR